MTASVVSGVISDTEPTKVVLPTPKPPATTIFTEVIAEASPPPCGRATLDLTESTKHPFEQVKVGPAFGIITLMDADEAVRAHVRDQDPRDAERQPQHRGDLGDGPQSRQNCKMAWHSGASTDRSRGSYTVAVTKASSASLYLGWVRPPVTVYGRTSRVELPSSSAGYGCSA